MKYFPIIILFFSISYSQTKKIVLIDEENKPVRDVLLIIENSPKYISDSLGSVFIEKIHWQKEILIRHLNYEKETFYDWYLKDTIVLKESINILKDIIVTSSENNKTIQYFPEKNISNISPKNFGNSSSINSNIEIAVFFPNIDKKNHIIKKVLIPTNDYSIILDLNKTKKEKRKNAKYSPLKVNLYTVDSIIGIPKEKIFKEDFIINCKIDEDYAVLNFSPDEELILPNEGIFISLKSLSPGEYQNLGFEFPPGIKQIGVTKKNIFIPYYRYIYESSDFKWKKYDHLINRNNTYFLGLELLTN